MKKARIFVILLVLILVIASPKNVFAIAADVGDGVSYSNAINRTKSKDTSVETTPKLYTEEMIEEMKSKNPFEKVISSFLLSMGDYAHDYLTQLFKQEVTIDGIVFNDVVLLNANFFTNSENPSGSDASAITRKVITTWYDAFRSIALLVCVFGIVVAGIKIMLGTPEEKNKAKDILKKVVLAVMLVYFFPYVMKMGFDINEAIINMIRSGIISDNNYVTESLKLKQTSELQIDPDMEFRSPAYVSNSSRRFGAGSSEANDYYFSKLQTYTENNDVMRIMRAFAGVSQRFIYVVIWYILLIQTYFMVVVYLKRYVVIAFLLAIYPLTIIGYVAGGLSGKSKTAFNDWCSKFFGHIFMQTIHALTYGVISGVIIAQLNEGLPNKVNWIVVIIAVTFLMTGEKILSNLWKLATNASMAKEDMKGMLGKPKKIIGAIRGK